MIVLDARSQHLLMVLDFLTSGLNELSHLPQVEHILIVPNRVLIFDLENAKDIITKHLVFHCMLNSFGLHLVFDSKFVLLHAPLSINQLRFLFRLEAFQRLVTVT